MRHPGFYFLRCLLLLIAVICFGFGFGFGFANAQSWKPLGPGGGDVSGPGGYYPAIATDTAGMPWVVYTDISDSARLMVKRLGGSGWTTVLGPSPAYRGRHSSIFITARDTVYVGYVKADDSGKTCVLKYDGTSWSMVGSPFSHGFLPATFPVLTSLVADDHGHLYFAWASQAGGIVANIVRFDGTDWVQAGSGSPWSSSTKIELAIDSSGTLYAGYNTYANLFPSYIVKLNGNNWDTLGTVPRFSAMTRHVKDSTLYVACQDSTINNSVRKFTGKTMTTMNPPGIQAATTISSMTVDEQGFPYLSFSEGIGGVSKASVKKYYGNNWGHIGLPGFSATSARDTRLAVGKGIPYIVYSPTAAPYHVYAMYYDASVSVTPLTTVKETVKAYPNPATDFLTVALKEQTSQQVKVILSDITGRVIIEQHAGDTGEIVIDIRSVTPGIYYLQINGADNEVMKMVIE